MPEVTLVREKLDQVPSILEEHGVDLWLTLVRETLLTRDPCLELISGTYCAWQGAFLLSRSGERIAIVGRYDAPSVERLGLYSEVVGYDESIRPPLRGTIERLSPETIAQHFAQDVSPEQANLIAVTQGAIRGTNFDEAVSVAAWESKPSWYIVAEQDHMIDPGLQQDFAKKISAQVTSLPASHVPMISRAEEVARVIIEAAEGIR